MRNAYGRAAPGGLNRLAIANARPYCRSTLALGTVPTIGPVIRIVHFDDAIATHEPAADAHLLVENATVPDWCEFGRHVQRFPPLLQWLSARSKASKLRQRRPAGSAVEGRFAISGNSLLRYAAMRAQRNVQPGEIVPADAGPEHGERSATITRSPTGPRQFEFRARVRPGQHELDAGQRGDALGASAMRSSGR